MGLDVYLYSPGTERECVCDHCDTVHKTTRPERLFDSNITHNLNSMAEAAGIYKELWRPEELGITTARELIAPLTEGLALLESDPERFKAFDSPNGWGLYVNFVPFVRRYLEACKKFPDAHVRASR